MDESDLGKIIIPAGGLAAVAAGWGIYGLIGLFRRKMQRVHEIGTSLVEIRDSVRKIRSDTNQIRLKLERLERRSF